MKYLSLLLLLAMACGKQPESTSTDSLGTISSEINLDHFPAATFDGDGHPVTITLKDGKIEVQDSERQLGV